jgi:hypothetical protein
LVAAVGTAAGSDRAAARRLLDIIARTYPLGEAGDAIRYLASGEPVGRVMPASS